MVEAASGRTICQAKCGEITTAMCLTNNLRHLITTSDHGIIYVWKLPIPLSNALRSQTAAHAAANYPLTVSNDYVENDLNLV